MELHGLRHPVLPLVAPTARTAPPATTGTGSAGFANRLGEAIDQLAESQQAAVAAERSYQLGQTGDLARVMMAQQVADLGLQLAVNVRNKALEAYKDVMNMPV